MNSPIGKIIKCPMCGNEGICTLKRNAYWFDCFVCGYDNLLKNISSADKDEEYADEIYTIDDQLAEEASLKII